MEKVYVEWYDAYERFGWLQAEEALDDLNEMMLCKTVGWLLDENDKRIIIAHTYNSTSIMGGLHIPLGCIKTIKRSPK